MTLTDKVEASIRQAIIDSNFSPGDKLPGELEFAADLGVSRNMVREAMSRLRMLGVVESRKKRGLILTEPDIFKGLDTVLELPVLQEKSREELYQMRTMLELGIIPLVFMNQTAQDIDYLEKLVKEEEADPSNLALAIRCDIQFHSRLYKMAKNDLLSRFQVLLKPFIKDHTDNFEPKRFSMTEKVSHRDLLETLKNGDVDTCMSLMRHHLSFANIDQ